MSDPAAKDNDATDARVIDGERVSDRELDFDELGDGERVSDQASEQTTMRTTSGRN